MSPVRAVVSSVMAWSVALSASACAPHVQTTPAAVPPPSASVSREPQTTMDIGDAAGLIAAVQHRFLTQGCWRRPAEFPNPETLIVTVYAQLRPDGHLASPPRIVAAAQEDGPPSVALDTARRRALAAVVQCAPYDDLPSERYEDWKELTFTFDPSELARAEGGGAS